MIIAKINEHEILDIDLENEICCLTAHSEIKEVTKEIKLKIIERIIDDYLLLQEAKKYDYFIDQNEVEMSYIDNIMLFDSEEEFNKLLDKTKMSISDVKKRLYNKILIKKHVQKFCKNTPGCSPEFISKFYTENKNYFLTEPQVSILNFVISNKIENAKNIISEIRDKIKNIDDFITISKELNQKNSHYYFSELGFISRGEMVREFENVAFSLEVNQVSIPFKTIMGHHIIAVVAKKEPCITKVNIIQDSLIERVKEIESELAIIKYIKNLRENSNIIIYEELL